MLAKLIKKDLARDFKPILTIFAVLIITTIFYKISLSILTGNLNSVITNFLTATLGGAYFIIALSSVVLPCALGIDSFQKTMLKDEGFLTHTLPVKTSQILLSKMITSYIWYALFLIIAIGLDLFLHGDEGIFFMLELPRFFHQLSFLWGGHPNSIAGAFFGFYLIFLPFIFNSIVYFLFSLSSALFSKKFLVILAILLLCLITFLYLKFSFNQVTLFEFPENISIDEAYVILNKQLFTLFLGIPILFNAVLYFLSNVLFKKKLNII